MRPQVEPAQREAGPREEAHHRQIRPSGTGRPAVDHQGRGRRVDAHLKYCANEKCSRSQI